MNLSTEMMDAVVTAQHVADLVTHTGILSVTANYAGTPAVHLTQDQFAAEFGDHLDGMGVYTDDCYIKWIMVAGVKVFCLIPRNKQPEPPKQRETCRERLQREYPEKVNPDYCGGCFSCPHKYGYAKIPPYCDGGKTKELCRLCWDRPVVTVEEVDD